MGGWLVLVLIGRGIVKDIVDLYVMLWEVTRLQSFKDKESFGTKTRRPGKGICSPAPAPALPLLPGSRQAHVVRPRGQPLHLPGGQVSSMMTGQVSGMMTSQVPTWARKAVASSSWSQDRPTRICKLYKVVVLCGNACYPVVPGGVEGVELGVLCSGT